MTLFHKLVSRNVDLVRVMVRWEWRVVTLLNLLAERQQVHLVSIEGALECCHLEMKRKPKVCEVLLKRC